MRKVYLVAYNIRSSLNVGSLFRTAEGLGVTKLYLTGYTPHPSHEGDNRLPHIKAKLDKQIQKTALNAQNSLDWQYNEDVFSVIKSLKKECVDVIALEQTKGSLTLHKLSTDKDIALVVGNEATGLGHDVIKACDKAVEIPMLGKKESFNVVQAAAMALYHLRYM